MCEIAVLNRAGDRLYYFTRVTPPVRVSVCLMMARSRGARAAAGPLRGHPPQGGEHHGRGLARTLAHRHLLLVARQPHGGRSLSGHLVLGGHRRCYRRRCRFWLMSLRVRVLTLDWVGTCFSMRTKKGWWFIFFFYIIGVRFLTRTFIFDC